jgi:hypothetical protein
MSTQPGPTDEQLLAGVVNRMGSSELTVLLEDVLKRLTKLEGGDKKFPPVEEEKKAPDPEGETSSQSPDPESSPEEEEHL